MGFAQVLKYNGLGMSGTRFTEAPAAQDAVTCGDRVMTKMMSEITINELEAAINFWRARSPSKGDELVLCKEASALSKPYAQMIVQRQRVLSREALDEIARDAWDSYVRFKNGL